MISACLSCFTLSVGFVLASCDPASVSPSAVAGVGVDAHNELVGYVAVCRGEIDAATLFENSGPKLDVQTPLGDWTAPKSIKTFAKWAMSEHSDWAPLMKFQAPSGTAEFGLTGLASDHSGGSNFLTFHLSDLTRLRPGQVLYNAGYFKTIDEGSFRKQACADAGMPVP
jgi:hypothetical protein